MVVKVLREKIQSGRKEDKRFEGKSGDGALLWAMVLNGPD